MSRWLRIASLLTLAAVAGCGRTTVVAPSPAIRATERPRAPEVTGAYVTHSRAAHVLTVGNGYLSRQLTVDPNGLGIATRSVRARDTGLELIAGPSEEFRIGIGGRDVVGFGGDLRYASHVVESDGPIQRVRIATAAKAGAEDAPNLDVTLVYEVRPDAPMIRKWLEVRNAGPTPIRLDDVSVERLHLQRLSRAWVWGRSGNSLDAPLPLELGPDSGLAYAQTASRGGGSAVVGIVNEAFGDLKRGSLSRDGEVDCGVQGAQSGIWVRPEETVSLPAVELWLLPSPEALAENALDLASLADPLRGVAVAADAADFYALPVDQITSERVAALPAMSVVCPVYAWQADWLLQGPPPANLLRAVETIRSSGRRVGLLVPIAWLPDTDDIPTDWLFGSGSEARVPLTWRGSIGIQASLASRYAVAAALSLAAICDALAVDVLLLDGPIAPQGTSGGSPAASRWELIEGTAWLGSAIRRSKSTTLVGIRGATIGVVSGYDHVAAALGFLWDYRTAIDPARARQEGGIWRFVTDATESPMTEDVTR